MQPAHDGIVADLPDLRPDMGQILTRSLAPAPAGPAGQARRQSRPVQRPGRSAADAPDLDSRLVQQPIQNTPGKGAMRAAALQGQVDPLHFHAARSRRSRQRTG